MDDGDATLHVNPILLARAREFRHPLTPAEQKVWARVRGNQLGCKLRRQQPIWRFIADFYCAPAHLVIEIDGDTHAAADQTEYDAARTAWLESRGYAVIRFDNNDVHNNIAGVLTSLQTACLTRIAARAQSPRLIIPPS
jgi:very-short-patch-repair endonuclease